MRTSIAASQEPNCERENVHSGAAPTGDTFATLQDITVRGNDPTASDTLIVNGTSGQDDIDYRPSSTIGSGEVDVNSDPAIIFTTMESVVIDGLGGNDNLRYISPSNDGDGNILTFTPGAVGDSATITGRQFGGTALVPLTYQHIGISGSVEFTSVDEGRADYLDVFGTAASDQFNLDPTNLGTLDIEKLDQPNNISVTVDITTPSISVLALHGLDGDDQFNLAAAVFYDNLIIDGGDPSASDVVNLSGPDTNVVVNLGNAALSTNTTIDGFGPTITLQGDEVVNVGLDNNNLTVNGTTQPESITYTPTGLNTGTFSVAGLNTVFNFSNILDFVDAFTINLMGGSDTVTVNGTSANDNIVVARSGSNTTAQVNGLQTLTLLTANTESLVIASGAGDDSLTVNASGGPILIPIVYDGGTGRDSLSLTGGTAGLDTYTPGLIPGSGTSVINYTSGGGGIQTVNFLNLEPVTDDVTADTAVVNGTDANNAIDYRGANNDTPQGLVTVDDQEGYFFTNKTHLIINAGAGDDVINLNNPGTPPNLTDITVNGNNPTASDTVIVNGTSGIDNVVIDQLTADGARITGAGPVPITVTTAEHLIYSGQGGNDHLTLKTPASSQLIQFSAGAAGDAGNILVSQGGGNSLLPIDFQGMGILGDISLADDSGSRVDELQFRATDEDDLVTVNSSGDLQARDSAGAYVRTLVVHTPGVRQVTLAGLAGDDVFRIAGNHPFLSAFGLSAILVEGGDPSASDVLNFTGSGTTANLITADFGASTVQEATFGPVGYTGIEVVNVDAANHNFTVKGTGGNDVMTVTPTGTSSATTQLSSSSPSVGSTPVINGTNITTFTIDPAGGSNTVTVNGTSGNDNITVTKSGANTVVTVNSTLAATIVSANTASLVIAGLQGNDNLTVDSSNGAVAIPIVYDGGTGTNALTLSGGTATSDTYTPGSQLGAGTMALSFASGNELINFLNLAPIFDSVAGPLTVLGTNASNAINYSVGFNNLANFLSNTPATTWGQVSVDSYEPIEFINKTSLTINALAGDDTINLNNPNTPAGFTGAITVNGGDPTASDKLIVNASTNGGTITYAPTGPDSGSITGAQPVTVNFNTTENVTINGQALNNNLTVQTLTGFDQNTLTPGTAIDSGTITTTSTLIPSSNPTLTFLNLGASGSLTFTDASAGRADTLIYNGTSASDVFGVSAAGVINLNSQIAVNTPGVSKLVLQGLDGDDTFNIPGNHPFSSMLIDGGNPSASDVLNFTGSGTTANLITADFGAATVQEATFGAVSLTGVELLNVNAANHNFTVKGTSGSDVMTVTPTGANAVTAQLNSANPAIGATPVINGSNIGTFNVDLLAGSDKLIVNGTQNADTIDVNDVASGANAVKVNSLETVNYNSSLAQLEIDALAGSDTINAAPSTTTTFTVDGGDPIGVLPGDQLNFIHPAAAYQLFPGPTNDSGGLNTNGFQTISWIHIESITNSGPGGPAIITGTNGNDIITIIARDSSTHAGTDGIQDFTVSINNGPDILFINTPNLLVDALAGNDQIHVREPAPNNAVWNTQIWVAGGTPAANTGNVGDQIVLETPGTQNVTYAPDVTAPALGGVTFGAASPTDSAQFNDTTNTSKITAVTSFSIAGFYNSSPGGVENFVYQGYAANDSLTYLSPANSNNGSFINFTPGATQDSGTITAQLSGGGTLVPLTFQGLGTLGTVTFTGTDAGRRDVLTVNGTAAGEVIVVNGPSGTVHEESYALGNSTTPTLVTTSIQTLTVRGLGGADRFDVIGALPYSLTEIQGSDPITNLSGATGPVQVTVGNNNLATNTNIQGYGGTVILVGIDTANLDANGNTVSVSGTSQPDAFVVTPTGAQSTLLTDSGINTDFNFTTVSTSTGGFVINPLGGSDTVTVNGTSSADDIVAIVNGSNTTVKTNSLLAVNAVTANTESLVIASGNGDDRLTVNASNGPVLIPVVYDGGIGRDLLWLTGGTASTDTYTPGPIPGSGRSQIVFTAPSAGTQTVDFLNLEPVQDDVTATTATVNADNAANAINYSQGPGFNDHGSGLVTVDNQETYEFSAKTHLVINALNGSDEINLNNPGTPPGLQDITVNGGDPTASDVLIVNGTSGNDTINYSPSATIGSGQVTITSLPTVIFTTIESLNIDGQGGNDALTVTTPTGGNFVTYTPGTAPDSGTIGISATGGGTARVPLTFQHIGAVGSSITFATAGVGRTDTLQLYGTNNSDTFNVNQSADVVQILSQVGLVTDPLNTGSITALVLFGLNGDDTFNIKGALPYTNGVIVDAGNPSASDTVNLSGATGAVTVNLANSLTAANTNITGYGSTVTLIGVEVANLNTSTFALTANGNSTPNSFVYIPTGPAAGTFTNAGVNTVFNFSNTAGTFTINGSVGSTSDQVTLQGTASRDLISIDQGARTASVTNVANVLYKTVLLGPDIQVLTAQGLSGQDTFLVTPAPGTQFAQSVVNPVGNTNNLLINVDGGGNAIGENNALVIATPTGGQLPNSDFVVVNRGALANSGTVRTYGQPTVVVAPVPNIQYPDVNYINIQTVSPFVGTDQIAGPFLNQPNLLILGPDLYEPNQNPVNGSPFNAAFLGSGPTINVQNVAIFPNNAEFPFVPADQDYYRVVAQNTGTLDFQVYFNLYDAALFPAGGNLNIQVLDVNGNIIATGTPANFGSVGTTMNARIRIPVVQGQTYYLRVFGANTNGTQNTSVVNGYNFTVVNTALVAPGFIDLSSAVPNGEPNAPLVTAGTPDTGQLPANAPPSDSGRSQFDNVTNGGFTSTATAAAAAAAGTAGTLPAPAGSTLAKPTLYIWVDDSFLTQDIPGNQTPGGVPGTSAIPINFNTSTTLVPTGTGNFRVAVYDGGGGAMTQTPGTSVNPSTNHTLDPNDPTFIGFAQQVPGVPHLYVLTVGSQGGATPNNASDTLSDGTHNITARIQIIDPSGTGTIPTIKTAFGPRSAPQQIIIDTVAPPIQFGFGPNGGGGLTPGSDSGVDTEPETFNDGVTNVTAPTFQGYAEANSIVRLYAQITNPANPNFGKPFPDGYVFIGETVAIPLDGTNAFPNGQWQLTSTISLNDPVFFLRDGIRNIVATAEDLAGNRSPVTAPFQIEIDTNGPQITDVTVNELTSADYNLFGLKPDNAPQGPTPLVYSIVIHVQDLPPRFAPFLNEIAFKPELVEGNNHADGGITVIGDANGRMAFQVFAHLDTPTPSGQPATGTITLVFTDANGVPTPIPDDRYTLFIDDAIIVDPAGNILDGESNAQEPVNHPQFPTGNGLPGGDFTARFTVDSRPELGDFAAARVYVDINGNSIYDPQNLDFVNRDLTFTMQLDPTLVNRAQLGVHDSVFAGNFAGARGTADGFAKLGLYGTDPTGIGFRWLLDTDDNGTADTIVPQPTGFTMFDQFGSAVKFNGSGIAYAGNFDGNAPNGDEVGLFDSTHFFLDTNHNFMIDAGDTVITTALRGFPIVGDFNGDGTIDLATWQTDVFQFNFGTPGTGGNTGIPVQFTGAKDATINWGFPGVSEIPLAADMDQDGITDIGLWVPGRSGTVSQDLAETFFLISHDFDPVTGQIAHTGLTDPTAAFNLLNHAFTPTPLGHDIYSNFLDEFATPIVGNFDPPLAPKSAAAAADTTAPTSSVSALAATQTSAAFTVTWGGSDNSGGSGIANYDVYVSDNGGSFTRWLHNTTNTAASYNGVNGHTYAFMSVATDNGGNVQATPAAAQATTKVQVQTSISTSTSLATSSASITTGQSVTFTATVTATSGTPAGSVTFKDGTTTLTTVTLVGGTAAYTTSSLAAGSHSITATYNAVAPNLGSVSTTLTQTVNNPTAPPPAPTGQTFTGTASADIFTLTPAAGGAITITISTNNVVKSLGTITPTGTITVNALGGNDTLKLATATIGGQVVTITAPIVFNGGDGLDTLLGANQANTWVITGLNAGTLNGNTFSGIENLSGGTAADTFRLVTGGSVTGKINGGTGANTLNYSGYSAASTVNRQLSTATGTGGIVGITVLVGGGNTSLIGTNVATAWNITGVGAGNVTGLSFSGISNITGGTAADTFTLANGAGLSGKLDGAVGTDILKYSYTTPVSVNLSTNTATGLGSIANLEGMVGGSASDTLVGFNLANTWTISATNSGKVNAFTFSGVENLTGGAMNDNFVLGAAKGVSGRIDGGAGINMLDYNAYTTAVTVNLNTGTATNIGGGVANIRVVRGGSAADNLTGDAGSNALIGGAGNDVLNGGGGHSLLFGGLGADTLNSTTGEDIMFSGTTSFDTNVASIDNLLAYWSRTDLDYATRVAALKAGTVVGAPKLSSTTVLNDTVVNTLNGGTGLDWFFAKLAGTTKDKINNQVTGEQVN